MERRLPFDVALPGGYRLLNLANLIEFKVITGECDQRG
jgi:hypothetical protein